MALDPQTAWVLEMVKLSGRPKITQLTEAQARAMYRETAKVLDVRPPPELHKIEDRKIPGPGGQIPVRVYTPVDPAGGTLPVLVFYHGGGWVIFGRPESFTISSTQAVCGSSAISGLPVTGQDVTRRRSPIQAIRPAPDTHFPLGMGFPSILRATRNTFDPAILSGVVTGRRADAGLRPWRLFAKRLTRRSMDFLYTNNVLYKFLNPSVKPRR